MRYLLRSLFKFALICMALGAALILWPERFAGAGRKAWRAYEQSKERCPKGYECVKVDGKDQP